MRALAVIARVGVAAALLSLSASAAAETDGALRTRVIGQWSEVRKLECEEHQQRMAIRADGTFEVTGLATACDAKTSFTWRGTWQVKGGKFRYTTTYSDPPEVYPLGETFEDKIISVTDDEWVMIEQSTGKKSIARRVK
jgi:hypothetical protein